MNGYKRRKRNIRDVRKVIVILCNGKTEKIYFNNYRTRNQDIKLLVPPERHLDPEKLVKYAKTQIIKWDFPEMIWCVCDVDQFTDSNIQNAIKEGGDKLILIISNPCFELWFLLHYVIHHGRLTTKDAITLLKRHIPQYKKDMDVYSVISGSTNQAISRAKQLVQNHRSSNIELNSTQSNPSTQIYKIIEYLI